MTYSRGVLALLFCLIPVTAQTPESARASLLAAVERESPSWTAMSRKIWENPELGFRETSSVALIRDALRGQGFSIRENLAGMPTAFVAEWGKGAPVIGIIGEYDALPGLSQIDSPERKPHVEGAPGHGCGHNLFGAASALAAVAVKKHLDAARLPGTIRFYGTPAEEGGAGKVYMIRAGLFKDADTVLAWHPWNANQADDNPWLANIRADVRYTGRAAHAAASPDAGRSALDAAEIFTHAVNLLREHVPQETRMHYVYSKGGSAANIVPDAAEVAIIARHPDQGTLESIWERLRNAAQAGALATGTEVSIHTVSGYANYVPNPTLRDLLDTNLRRVGGVVYTTEERRFAEAIRATLGSSNLPPLDDAAKIMPPKADLLSASTDVGDVSWTVPTGHLLAATFPPGVPLHTWQSTAVAGTTLGQKGLLVAAKTLALTAADIFHSPVLAARAKADFANALKGRAYRSLIPANATPPLP
jgi:aminobenzoyl-glutamate utilization protein B